ncbi:MAG: conjugal transfer protein TraF [Gammaproteobacteria bacterium]|nr:conjugal transfer protein TraF [Gammaproteobacteria bacterium]
MFKRGLLTAGLLAATFTTASAGTYGYYDARSVAMGNVSVATGGITTAAFANPAMLAVNESGETFGFVLGAGLAAIDNGGIIDGVDDFQALDAQFTDQINNSQLAEAVATLQQEVDLLNSLNNSSLVLDANANTAFIYGGDDYTFALSFKANGEASVALQNLYIPAVPVPGDQPTADIYALGTVTQEIGLSIATRTTLLGMDVAVGVTPKIVSVEAVDYLVSVDTADVANVTDTTPEDLGSYTSLDAGIVFRVTDSINAGLIAKNLLEKSFYTTPSPSTPVSRKVEFARFLRAGVSYHNEMLTLAADLDLTETDPVLAEDPTKMLSIGMELDAFDIVQIRAGYQTNTASGADNSGDLVSVGVGVWLGFNLDIAAVKSDDSLGAFIQTGFRF